MVGARGRFSQLSQRLPAFDDKYDGDKMRQMVRILEAPIVEKYITDDVVTVTASMSPYDVTPGVRLVLADATAGAIVINRPFAVDHPRRAIGVVKIDASINTVTDTCQAGDTINGAATRVVSAQYAGHDAYSNGGTAWFVLP